MEVNRQRLAARISATLRAKQFLVFYAIVLLGIDFAVPLLAIWAYRPRAFADLFANGGPAFSVFVDAPGALSIAIVLGATVLVAWLRCGYIRSIVGRMHYGPASVFQFLSMFGVLLITGIAFLGLDMLARALDGTVWAGLVVGFVQLALSLVLLYADYSVVISGIDPVTALRRSVRVVQANVITSLAIMLAVTLLSMLIYRLIDPEITGTLPGSLGLVVLRVVTLGMVTFIADVALIMVYIDSVERGALALSDSGG